MSNKAVEEQPSSPLEKIPDPYGIWINFLIDKFAIVFALLLLYFWKENINPKLDDIKQTLDQRQALGREIYECLSSIRTTAKADRAVLGQFHNGSYWASGVPWISITATHEVTAFGATKVSKDIKNVPIEKLGEEIKWLMEKDILVVNLEDAQEGCDKYLYSIGCTRIIEALVSSEGGKPLGILSIQYNRNTKLHDLEKEEKESIIQAISVLGSVMKNRPQKDFFAKLKSLFLRN